MRTPFRRLLFTSKHCLSQQRTLRSSDFPPSSSTSPSNMWTNSSSSTPWKWSTRNMSSNLSSPGYPMTWLRGQWISWWFSCCQKFRSSVFVTLSRLPHLIDLFQCIRLNFVSRWYLIEIISKDGLVSSSPECVAIIQRAKDQLLAFGHTYETSWQLPTSRKRTGLTWKIIYVNTYDPQPGESEASHRTMEKCNLRESNFS